MGICTEILQTEMGKELQVEHLPFFENSWFTVKSGEDKAMNPLVFATLLKVVHLLAQTSANVLNLGSR